METTIRGIKIQSNDSEGDKFLNNFVSIGIKFDNLEKAFSEFCNKENIGGWHNIDGWWQAKEMLKTKDGLNTSFGGKEINVTWFQKHKAPLLGELCASIYECIPSHRENPFIVYLYRVKDIETTNYYYGTKRYILELESYKWCRFNHSTMCFEFFVPPLKKPGFIKKTITYLQGCVLSIIKT